MGIQRRQTIRIRLLTAIAGVTTCACVVFGIATSLQLRNITLEQTRRSLTSMAQVTAHDVAAGLDFNSPASVRNTLSGLFSVGDIRFASIVQPNGGPFISMGEPLPAGYSHSFTGRSRVEQAGGILIATVPIRNGSNAVIGELLIGSALDHTRRVLAGNVLLLVLLTVSLAAISVMIGNTIGRRIATPLLLLTDAARQVAAGRFDEPLTIKLNDEVGILASTFNRMSKDLAESRSQVERTNQELEERIKARTEELRQKNIALEMQTEQALDASRLKSSFLANVSHELRTPMNAILALSELMKDGLAGEMTEEQRSHITMIHRSGTGLLRLINDVLDLSKIEAGRMELHVRECDILEEIRRAAVEMQPLASSKGLDLRIRIEAGPRVRMDPDRVRQILVNLLGNAVKFTERGYVEVDGGIDTDRGELCFSVRDTGIGIAPEHIRTVFQEFRQADGSPSRRFGGTGLGLSISLRLAEMMGGRISLESALGRGSHFRTTLPVESVTQRSAPDDRPGAVDDVSKAA